ncbi:MAG TPA: DUF4159 domain-containing protein [Bryobacteraceae bacterium]|nr:DUF4159 domain-containing protein [Bryobacteraceae bacterium]
MGFRKVSVALGCAIAFLGTLYAFQRPFRQYPGVEYRHFELPPGSQEKTEWAFARLMYPPGWNDGYRGRFDGDWREGLSLWTQDYPRADRHFSEAVKRLTRLHVRSVEQPINLDDGDEVYNWPWLYAVQVGEWGLTDAQADKLRDYLLRGGFFMADDFHGETEWQVFEERMKRVFPNRPIVEIANDDPIFHTVYDLDDRYQVPGAEHLRTGYKNNGRVPHWRAIYDDHGRIMVAISFNSDIGDAWEWADEPEYPEKYSALAIRLGVNYIIYAMTH